MGKYLNSFKFLGTKLIKYSIKLSFVCPLQRSYGHPVQFIWCGSECQSNLLRKLKTQFVRINFQRINLTYIYRYRKKSLYHPISKGVTYSKPLLGVSMFRFRGGGVHVGPSFSRKFGNYAKIHSNSRCIWEGFWEQSTSLGSIFGRHSTKPLWSLTA